MTPIHSFERVMMSPLPSLLTTKIVLGGFPQYKNMTTSEPDYKTMCKEELISLLQQGDTQIQLLKSGYLYVVQFENDKQSNIYKMGKTSLITI